MRGHVVRKGNRWYAVIYEGIDPVTGRERRSWHAAGTDRADAERLVARLVADLTGRNDLLDVARKAAAFLDATSRNPAPEFARCAISTARFSEAGAPARSVSSSPVPIVVSA